MFDNLFALVGPLGTATMLVSALLALVGFCRVGQRVQRMSQSPRLSLARDSR